MIRKLSHKFIDYICEDKYLKEEKEQMEYILNTIIFETLKLFFTVIIFSILGYFKESVITIIIMCIIKPYIGGYHEDSQIKCFIATMLLTAGIIFMSRNTMFSFWSNCVIICFSVLCMYHQVPVINLNMPITLPHLIQKNRKKGLRNTILCGLVSIILYKYSKLYCVITWTIIIETLLLFNKKNSKEGF